MYRLGLSASDAHVPRRTVIGARGNPGIMTARLVPQRFVELCVDAGYPISAVGGAQIDMILMPQTGVSLPSAVSRIRLQQSQKFCVMGVISPRRAPSSFTSK